MTPEQQLPVLETSILLKEKGWKTETLFRWIYSHYSSGVYLRNELTPTSNEAPAPTVQELLTEFSIMILKDGEIDEEIADRVDNLVLHCWAEPNLAQLLAELWLETRKEVQP